MCALIQAKHYKDIFQLQNSNYISTEDKAKTTLGNIWCFEILAWILWSIFSFPFMWIKLLHCFIFTYASWFSLNRKPSLLFTFLTAKERGQECGYVTYSMLFMMGLVENIKPIIKNGVMFSCYKQILPPPCVHTYLKCTLLWLPPISISIL